MKPLLATTEKQLKSDLLIILSVRHINGAKKWKNASEDTWIFRRYKEIFNEKHSEKELFWDREIVQPLAIDSNITENECKQRLRAISWFTHFKDLYSSSLPIDPKTGKQQQFIDTDYIYLNKYVKIQL